MTKGSSDTPHTALYRKYRSRSLDEVVGQSQVTELLRRSLAQGKVAHAYLLTGPRGVGKTSIARILAHEINNLPYGGEETHLDIIEIDAASNNGVDDVRDLRDKVQLAPTSAPKKVYIIDEVHMLSKAAFNALLKTLEEPPEHIVFILATTDLHKVPATIISRTQHYSFHSISHADLAGHLRKIADSEGIKITDDALAAIASRGGGSFRDSISLLDQLSGFADGETGITLDLVQSMLGLASDEAVQSLLTAISDRDVAAIVQTLDDLERQGIQPVILADQLVRELRSRLGDQPHYVTLLDALLGVMQSPQPQLKLLTVLVGAVKPKTAAEPVAMAKPLAAMVEKPLPKSQIPNLKSQNEEKPLAIPQKEEKKAPAPAPEVIEEPVQDTPAPKKKSNGPAAELDWEKLIEYTKKEMVPLYSVLSKCSHEQDGIVVTIYAGRKFNKTKLDEVKYLVQLQQAMEAVGVTGVEIVTLPYGKPPADEKLAKVAEMMGGGQEVTLEEESK